MKSPEPTMRQRLYNGRKLMVWEGKVEISSIQGWVENPRIEIAKKNLISKIGDRELTQAEIFDLMKNDEEVRLKELRDDIIKNGLREPLTLSYDGKLLDGNRRFFALLYALEGRSSADPNRQDLEIVDVFVLDEGATNEDEQNVLVEENFSPSLKIEWPDYVKALKVIDANDAGMSVEEIAQKFSWTKSKVSQTIRIHEIIIEFMTYATTSNDPNDEDKSGLGLTELEAEAIVAKKYQQFNEAQKSFFQDLKTDFNFKIQFFEWVAEGKFASFPEVRIAYRAWQDPEARAAILQSRPTAAKEAKAIIEYNYRVVKNRDEIIGRIETFTKFLKEMPANQVKLLSKESKDNLKNALEIVLKMSKAASE